MVGDRTDTAADRQDAPDAELARSLVGGDRRALEVLYSRHAPWLLLRLQRRCADRDLVDEVLQDTFVALWRGIGKWKGEGELGAWLWGIAIRRLVDALRRRPAQRILIASADASTMESAEDRVLAGVEFGDLGGALRRLSPELRAVVQATVLDGLTTSEASALLGIPAGTVKTRMMRARGQLRGELA